MRSGTHRAIALLGLFAAGCGGPGAPVDPPLADEPPPAEEPATPSQRAEPSFSGGPEGVIEIRAIYGMPMTPERERRMAGWIDKDGDGFDETNDCDDHDADIYPCMPDSEGDGVDSNCDGVDGVKPDNGQDCP